MPRPRAIPRPGEPVEPGRGRRRLAGGLTAVDGAGTPAPSSAFALLAGNRPFLRLWSSRALSFVGSSLGLIALLLHVAGTSGRAWAVTLLLLVGISARRYWRRCPERSATGSTSGR